MKYLLFLIIGIIIFLLLNNREGFSVGAPRWRDFLNSLLGCPPEPVVRVLPLENERIATHTTFILNIGEILELLRELDPSLLPPFVASGTRQRVRVSQPDWLNRRPQRINDVSDLHTTLTFFLRNFDLTELSEENQVIGYIRGFDPSYTPAVPIVQIFTNNDILIMRDYIRQRFPLNRQGLAAIEVAQRNPHIPLPLDVARVIAEYLPRTMDAPPVLHLPLEMLQNPGIPVYPHGEGGAPRIPTELINNIIEGDLTDPCNIAFIIRTFLLIIQRRDRLCAARRA